MSRAKIAALLLALSLLPPAARAEPIWGYRSPTNSSVQTSGEGAGVTFPNTAWADAGGGHITATPVVSWSLAPMLNPDRVSGEIYVFELELKDYASGQTEALSFGGLLTGSLWKDGVSLTNSFAAPTAQSVELGLNRYTVELDAFEPPTGFGEAKAGRFTADVTVTALGDPTPPEPAAGDGDGPPSAQTPEPGTVVLAGIALAAGAGWARSRQSARPTGRR